jgi:predicted MFS family arabinose efflux permease
MIWASKGAVGQAVTTTGLVAAISGPIVVTGMGTLDRRRLSGDGVVGLRL